uniref:Uncharacterized protein n=1 Tax=Arundo donax TaxID=35708 RepID=A0A0A9AUX9_ARUDO
MLLHSTGLNSWCNTS